MHRFFLPFCLALVGQIQDSLLREQTKFCFKALKVTAQPSENKVLWHCLACHCILDGFLLLPQMEYWEYGVTSCKYVLQYSAHAVGVTMLPEDLFQMKSLDWSKSNENCSIVY